MRPHRQQPTRLPRPWDSSGKNTGVGCHFLLQCMKVKSESEFIQSCPTPSDPMDCSLPGSSTHGIFQVRVLEWGAIAHTLVYLLSFSKCMNLCNPSFYHGIECFCHSRKFPHALSQSVPCLHSPEAISILNFFLTTDYQLFENFTQFESFAMYSLV